MLKRISSRGIIIEDNFVYLMFRRRILEDGIIKEYYVVPGGGINEGETLQENIIRELKEELSVDVKINGYIGKDENKESIAYFFSCTIINGTPKLGGEELERSTEKNYYEIRKVSITKLAELNLLFQDKIIKASNQEYTQTTNSNQ